MGWVQVEKSRETDIYGSLIREGLGVDGKNNYRKLSKFMRRKGMIGSDERIIAIEYLPHRITDNLRVIVGRR